VRAPRNISIAFGLSILAHLAIMAIPLRQQSLSSMGPAMPVPLTVHLLPAEPSPPEPPSAPVAEARPVPPQPSVARPHLPPTPAPRPVETPQARPTLPEPARAPAVDMLAAINAQRERRRAAEAAAAARQLPMGSPATPQDEVAATINRNLRTTPGVGVSGVFEILSKGTRRAEFAFNGWRPDSQRKWREVIEVDAGPGGDIERAIVRRMIELIRSHYSGDFNWESHRLGRIVVLSARPQDSQDLEDFLVREFFGTPILNRPR
jgi:outer membrane biosynthesis protein TonB